MKPIIIFLNFTTNIEYDEEQSRLLFLVDFVEIIILSGSFIFFGDKVKPGCWR